MYLVLLFKKFYNDLIAYIVCGNIFLLLKNNNTLNKIAVWVSRCFMMQPYLLMILWRIAQFLLMTWCIVTRMPLTFGWVLHTQHTTLKMHCKSACQLNHSYQILFKLVIRYTDFCLFFEILYQDWRIVCLYLINHISQCSVELMPEPCGRDALAAHQNMSCLSMR